MGCKQDQNSGPRDQPTVIFAPALPAEASANTVLEGTSPKISPTNDIFLSTAPHEPEEENYHITHNKSIVHSPYFNNDGVVVSLDIYDTVEQNDRDSAGYTTSVRTVDSILESCFGC